MSINLTEKTAREGGLSVIFFTLRQFYIYQYYRQQHHDYAEVAERYGERL